MAETRRGSYEVYIDVRHYPRHNEDFEKQKSQCWRYVDTGDPEQMVANALREFAAEIRPEEGDLKSEESIFAALDHVRAATMNYDPMVGGLIREALNSVATRLGLEWYGAIS